MTLTKRFFWTTLGKRLITPDQVYISNHFINRYNQRRLDPEPVYKLINKFCSNICKILYEFETGKETYTIEHENIVLKLAYHNSKIFFMTCFDKTKKD